MKLKLSWMRIKRKNQDNKVFQMKFWDKIEKYEHILKFFDFFNAILLSFQTFSIMQDSKGVD